MADLKSCFEGLGFANVKTVLQTGNVLFESSENDPKDRVETALTKSFNYPAKAQVIEVIKLQELIDACPYSDQDDGFHAYVIFLENGLEKSLAEESIELGEGEEIAAGDGVVYWHCIKGNSLQSQFGKLLSKAKYRDFNTNRNLKTLRKILALSC
jgi:uncharacterized protein (DUF1697 family)